MKILIPTCRSYDEIRPQIEAIRAVTTPEPEIIVSCLKASASVNRNHCLDRVEVGEIAVMIDDDISGFYPGWIEDLTWPFGGADGCDHEDPDNSGLCIRCQSPQEFWNTVMVSARLLNTDGSFGPTCSMCYDATPEEIILRPKRSHCIMPTAAIAFLHRGHKFMESMIGSGWEDNAWAAEYVDADKYAVFIQSNRCRLVHFNEAKNQRGAAWEHNRQEFFKRWPNGIPWRT